MCMDGCVYVNGVFVYVCADVYIDVRVCVERVVSAQKLPKDTVNFQGTHNEAEARWQAAILVSSGKEALSAHTHAHTLTLETPNSKAKVIKATSALASP